MDTNSIYTIIITAVTVLGSTSAWRFYEQRALSKEKAENYIKESCEERIAKLEALLDKAAKEKDEMRITILKLTAEVAELRVKVEFLEKEEKTLIDKININHK
jgi:hypothetical protein